MAHSGYTWTSKRKRQRLNLGGDRCWRGISAEHLLACASAGRVLRSKRNQTGAQRRYLFGCYLQLWVALAYPTLFASSLAGDWRLNKTHLMPHANLQRIGSTLR